MNIIKTSWLAGLAVGMALAFGAFGRSTTQIILIDDFNDGNDDGWSHFVLPQEDAPWGPGIFDATR